MKVIAMKRTGLLLLLMAMSLLTGCTASAPEAPAAAAQATETPVPPVIEETVANMLDAPATYSAQWTSRNGNIRIMVDAAVEVPQVETFYEIDTAVRPFTFEEVQRVFAAFGRPYTGAAAEYTEGKYSHTMTVSDGCLTVIATDGAATTLYNTDPTGTYKTLNNTILQRQGVPNNCRYAYDEALTMADAAANLVAPGFTMTGWGVTELYPADDSDLAAGEDYQYSEGYVFCYTPVVEGVPLQHVYTDAAEINNYGKLPYSNRLYITVTDDGLFSIRWNGVEDYGDKRVCALLPFEQIMRVAQDILPLAHVEQEQLHGSDARLWVDKITLSYCRVQKRNAPDEYMLIPVWDFIGCRGFARNGEEVQQRIAVNETLLTINAVDGTVVDRQYGY